MGQYTRSIACILLLSLVIPFTHATDYSATELFLTIYSDGYVDVSYGVLVDSSIPKVNVPLFGSSFEDILIINQEEKILDYVINGTGLIIDTLGSNNILISYSTPALTSKTGSLWSLQIISPVTMGVLLSEGSTIISLSQIPLELSTVNNRPYVTMPQGKNEIAYILGSVGTKEHALVVLKDTQVFIQGVKSRGIIVTSAESLLNQAQLAYNAANYIQAEQLANQAKNEATNTENLAINASSSITA
ncbi:hypothetical protein FJY84_05020, partial [Candidatus Bathyarchaeota archaeon]|nr:hypothetical protein [Candidatus Bathyarchaeota archaeon]